MTVTGPAWPSTKALADALAGVKSDLVVKWGSGGANGLAQLKAFQAHKVPCPEHTADLATAKSWVRSGSRVFGRRLHHTQGTDIVGAGWKKSNFRYKKGPKYRAWHKNPVFEYGKEPPLETVSERFNPEWLRRDFWVKVIDAKAEYRQHIWDGRAIRVGKKVQVEKPSRIQPVRSRRNGWHIDYGWKSSSPDFTERIRAVAKTAVAALGYHGGAVDILEAQDGTLYVLEVNSAPSLADANTLGAYVQAIQRWVKREGKKNVKTNGSTR